MDWVSETSNLKREVIYEFIPVDDVATDESEIILTKSSSSVLDLVNMVRSEENTVY